MTNNRNGVSRRRLNMKTNKTNYPAKIINNKMKMSLTGALRNYLKKARFFQGFFRSFLCLILSSQLSLASELSISHQNILIRSLDCPEVEYLSFLAVNPERYSSYTEFEISKYEFRKSTVSAVLRNTLISMLTNQTKDEVVIDFFKAQLRRSDWTTAELEFSRDFLLKFLIDTPRSFRAKDSIVGEWKILIDTFKMLADFSGEVTWPVELFESSIYYAKSKSMSSKIVREKFSTLSDLGFKQKVLTDFSVVFLNGIPIRHFDTVIHRDSFNHISLNWKFISNHLNSISYWGGPAEVLDHLNSKIPFVNGECESPHFEVKDLALELSGEVFWGSKCERNSPLSKPLKQNWVQDNKNLLLFGGLGLAILGFLLKDKEVILH